jgi:dephospho-CoA kinase
MLVIGLVGGIGSGKSVASAMLAELGAEVINADLVGHDVYEPGKPGYDAIVAAFGAGVVGEDGRIDRKKLGPIVFADGAKLERLNAIVHPLIRAELERRIARARAEGRVRAVVVEAAILLEAGWRSLVDQVWVVAARREDVVERLAAQRGMAAAETDARRAKQMTDAERRSAADVVIENVGSLDDLRTRLAGLWQAVVPR